jgi:hypothetical protein
MTSISVPNVYRVWLFLMTVNATLHLITLTGIDPIDDLLKPPSMVVFFNVNVSRETCVKHVSEMCKVQGEKFNLFPLGPSCPIWATGWSNCAALSLLF